MSKRFVIDIGNCGPDHHSIKRMLEQHFDVEVVGCADLDASLELMKTGIPAVILVNRKLDHDYSDGLEVIRQLKEDPKTSAIPVMLLSNYADYQSQALALGAELGFGKSALNAPETLRQLARVLERGHQPTVQS
jgi:CheY-like chemotaxis protein